MKLKRVIITLILLTFMVVAYQNCSDIKLAQRVENSTSLTTTKGDICSLPALSNRDKIKFLFVVDMSASNNTPNNPPYDVEGSDITSQRFKAIQTFLTQNCISQNTKSKIAIVGFAHANIVRTGTSCNKAQFHNFSDITSTLNYFKQEDALVRQDCKNGGTKCSQYTTNYTAGLDCAESIIEDDIANPDADGQKSFYMTFFLTDGEPFTGVQYQLGTPTYNNFKNQVTSQVRALRAHAQQNSLGMVLKPIFYGTDYLQRKDPSGVKQNLADNILTAMAEEGASEYTLLNTIYDLNLCSYLDSGTRVPYRMKHFVVTNLTAVKKGQQLLADSDMDGIPDIQESDRGFDPTTPRSMAPNNFLIDGTCGGLNASSCGALTAYKSCGVPNATGLTQCDVDRLNLSNGLDSNGDGFLDIMALVKGLSPNATSPFVDGDSFTEAEELRVGRDPKYPDDTTPDNLLVKYEVTPSPTPLNGCPEDQESIQFNILKMPLVRTLATKATDVVSAQIPWLHHKQDENVILVYYILTPANSNLNGELRDQVYAKFLKINTLGVIVSSTNFKKVGEIRSSFEDSKE